MQIPLWKIYQVGGCGVTIHPNTYVPKYKVATSPNTFVIKSPFKPSFKSFLSSELQADEENGAQSEHSDGDETIRTREDEVTEKQVLLDQSDNCSWLGDENPLELYNQAHSYHGGGSLIQDDFFELKKGIMMR